MSVESEKDYSPHSKEGVVQQKEVSMESANESNGASGTEEKMDLDTGYSTLEDPGYCYW